ncbi:Unknown protein sequence [Pseudomonas amygdali pv. mori]|uniref:Uncharacterized protein n=1 Tax=Pseudomonas amygdali pv. mori TaxID=34065 RepID=A0A0P9ZMN4_PSEA0|nr:Unknown protein sequence [Pseudomonas amygdali pv. mori]
MLAHSETNKKSSAILTNGLPVEGSIGTDLCFFVGHLGDETAPSDVVY